MLLAGSSIRIACLINDFFPLILDVMLEAMSSSNETTFEEFLPLIYTTSMRLLIVVEVPIIDYEVDLYDSRTLSKVRKEQEVRLLLTVSLMRILMIGL